MKNYLKILLGALIIFIGVWWYFSYVYAPENLPELELANQEKLDVSTLDTEAGVREFAFAEDNLKTNTANRSIALDQVLDGGPGKDGIPAINNPKFVSVTEAKSQIDPETDGLLVSVGDETRFYPYSILVWHEIVNDIINDKPLAITFCPLCGSGIVFETEIKGQTEKFGVSGKLYESNLLMYDHRTESLWSQSIGTAVVGDRTGEKLTVYPSQLVSFAQVIEKWPKAKVLSTDTGFSRNYGITPYGGYESSEDIYFPISVRDERLPAKEIMYVVNVYDRSVAFQMLAITEKPVSVDVGGREVTVQVNEQGEITARDDQGNILPGYFEMWFSWAIHHQQDGVVWHENL